MSLTLEELKAKTYWHKCSTCKKELPFGGAYYITKIEHAMSASAGLRTNLSLLRGKGQSR